MVASSTTFQSIGFGITGGASCFCRYCYSFLNLVVVWLTQDLHLLSWFAFAVAAAAAVFQVVVVGGGGLIQQRAILEFASVVSTKLGFQVIVVPQSMVAVCCLQKVSSRPIVEKPEDFVDENFRGSGLYRTTATTPRTSTTTLNSVSS